MMDNTVPLTFKPVVDGDSLKAAFRESVANVEDLVEKINELRRSLVVLGPEVAKALGSSNTIQSPTDLSQLLRGRTAGLLGAQARRGRLSHQDLADALSLDAPAPVRQAAQGLAELDRMARAKTEAAHRARRAKIAVDQYNKTYEGRAERYAAGIENSRDERDIQREVFKAKSESPEGMAYRERESVARTQNRAINRLMDKKNRPAALRYAAQKLGITLPEDLNPFAKVLQDTFKSAVSVGMLEAISGGNAAPLAKAFAQNIIAGALLPSALHGFSMVGSAVGTVASGAGGILGSLLGRGTAVKTATTVAEDAAPGVEQAAGGLVGGLGGTLGPAAAAIALTGLLAGGAALGVSSQFAKYSTMEEQLAAAVGGTGRPGDERQLLDQVGGAGQKFYYSPDTVKAVAAGLGSAGVQQGPKGQTLRSTMDNALMLGRLTGTAPGNFTGLVGSLATAGGMSADDITKMLGLLMKQNELTAANRVPLDTMVGNLQALVSATGGLPVNAKSVAGLTALTQKFLGMGRAGKSLAGAVGQVAAPLMGATGTNAMMAEAMFGLSPAKFAAIQNDPIALFNQASQFVQNQVSGIADPTQRLQAVEGLLQTIPLLGGSGLGTAQQTTLAQGLLANNPNQLTAQGKLIAGELPTDANAVKSAINLLAKNQTGGLDQGTQAFQQGLLKLSRDQTTSLQQIVQLLGRSTGSGFSTNPDIMAYETAHGGPPSEKNGRLVNPDGTPYRGPVRGQPSNYVQSGSPVAADAASLIGGEVADHPSIYSPGFVPNYPTRLANIRIPQINLNGTRGMVSMSQSMYSAARAASVATGVPLQVLMAQWAREGAVQPEGGNGGLGQFTSGATAWVDAHVKGLADWSPANETAATGFLAMASYDKYNTGLHGGDLQAGLAAYNGSGPAAANYGASVIQASQGIQATPITIVIVDKTKNGVKAQGSHS